MPRPSKKASPLEIADKVAKPKTYGERVPFKKSFKARVQMGDAEWKTVEEASGLKLEQERRDRIHLFITLYSSVGPLYADTQSVLAKTAEKEIKSWQAATARLWRALSPADRQRLPRR